MHRILFALALSLGSTGYGAASNLYTLSAETIDGKSQKLAQYQGKVTLVVNTASQCGYTGQYKDIEALYRKYKDRGLVVLGFPSNDFGGQEPGSNAEIKKFCEKKFKVSFPLFSKNPVVGENKQPVYRFLTEHAEPKGEVKWNFEKFLVDRHGKVVGRYSSKVNPVGTELELHIQMELDKKPDAS